MVSFSCEACGDVLTKKKLDPHRNRCRDATYTCIDCMVYFPGTEYRSHTTCITEDQKYQGALYNPKKQKSSHPTETETTLEPKKRMSQNAYVEDVTEGYEAYREYEINSDDDNKSTADLPPEAPTPPSAIDTNVNVFDFLVANATPNASILDLQRRESVEMGENTQLVRYDQDANGYVDQSGDLVEDEDMIHYGTGPIPSSGVQFETPAPKAARKKTKDGEHDVKKDKKRKRLHIETSSPPLADGPGDQIMTDAPPELHTGLTGGLNTLMRHPQFPPSPDLSGGDANEKVPASPIKKSKHSKSTKSKQRETSLGQNLMALMSGSSKTTKASKKRKHSSERKEKKRHHHKSDTEKSAPKLIEFRPPTADGKDSENQMVLFKPRSELFLGMCTKGPDSERGYSMNKALKRYHRQRSDSGTSLGKATEEKELWRSLRMRRNERGEIVLFSI